ALILALSPRFVYQARMLTMDGLLCLWITAAWATAHLALADGKLRWGYWLLAGMFFGVGLLTKGPVALVLGAIPVALLAVWATWRGALCVPWFAWPIPVLTALAAAGPWYATMACADPAAATEFFWLHNVQRFVAPFDHAKPFWYYGPILLLGALP